MPNFDGGHYFLSTLAPIRVGSPADLPPEEWKKYGGDPRESFLKRAQRALSIMATALQSPATQAIGVNSPFSKSLRTHLCRFVILEDAVYNGRRSANPLSSVDPLVPQSVDQLPCPYLMFVVDFDAVTRPGEPLPETLTEEEQDEIRDDYLKEMWKQGSAELLKVYENCQDFDAEKVKTPADFAAYIGKCQIDTWMSFNDYYIDPPSLYTLPKWPPIIGIGVPLVASIVFFLAWILRFDVVIGLPTLATAIVAFLAFAVITYLAYRFVLNRGQTAWPAAKDSDLPSVLKGLYLQQKFSDFVVDNQGVSDTDLHKSFGKFLDSHKPGDVLDPETTQSPGVIKS
ncbi:MAG: hypothetical protein RDA78_04880 [Roseibium sp.]|uniref:hypothetical protein n=1 Tax=Roseibium sp. TaxID=1936156 RepID=UPI003D9C2920